MNGFGFIEYEDAMDAKDVVPGKDTIPWLFSWKNSPRIGTWIC